MTSRYNLGGYRYSKEMPETAHFMANTVNTMTFYCKN